MVTRHATGHNTVNVEGSKCHTTLPVSDEVLEVIVDVSRKIFHFNTLTVVLISRHDSLTYITPRI